MKKDNKGFSLVELIIVIAIMAVLIGILAPQYLKYVNKSKVSTDITNAQEIQAAFSAAIADGQLDSNSTSPSSGKADGETSAAGLGIENFSVWPKSQVDSGQTWIVKWSVAKGVEEITLGGDQVYPNASAYQSAHGVTPSGSTSDGD